MADKTCDCGAGNVPADQASTTLNQQLASLDPHRAAAFDGLLAARSARGAGYAREQNRLTRKYGADHPRVAALADKIQFNDGLRRDAGFEAARARTEAPAADKAGYVFHGFVRDRAGQGVPRLTIALYDDNKNWISELGYGCTDENGYFIMRYQRGKTDPGVSPGSFAAGSGKRTAAGDTGAAAHIYVVDSKQTTLQVEPEPLYPQLGQVDFRIIILGAQAAPCVPPPAKPNDPAPPKPTTSTPLENIRGIGPVHARKLRAAGIKDVEALLQTDTAKLVKIAGFDAKVVKRQATAVLKKNKKK